MTASQLHKPHHGALNPRSADIRIYWLPCLPPEDPSLVLSKAKVTQLSSLYGPPPTRRHGQTRADCVCTLCSASFRRESD
jgi:hypothetical protein